MSHGSDVFDLNADGETACDLAVKSGHFDVADFLELKMVFAVSGTIDQSLQVVVHSLSCWVTFLWVPTSQTIMIACS